MKYLLFLLLVSANITAHAANHASEDIETGRKLYMQGILSSGKPLQGKRSDTYEIKGAQAACMLCHRPSGMGLAEGASLVPPISARALFDKFEFKTVGRKPAFAPGTTFIDWPYKTRPVYNDKTLAQAIRTGISPNGYRFKYMMPRYNLSDRDMHNLIAYLHTLSTQPSPGISDSEAQIATVITPDVDTETKQAFLQVLDTCVKERSPEGENTGQHWQLNVWELSGTPDTWKNQLDDFYSKKPVFALLSGLGANNWKPVEQYCEANGIPCLFPNVGMPGSQQENHYTFYFSRGYQLEADVLSTYLAMNAEHTDIKNVLILSPAQGPGAEMASTLKSSLETKHIPVRIQTAGTLPDAEIDRTLLGLNEQTALVLTLDESNLAKLSTAITQPPQSGMLIFSGLMGGLENTALAAEWRKKALMTYPYDAPVRWNLRMNYNLRPWLSDHAIKSQDERMQGNTLSACNLFYEGMLRLRGQYLREYLIENIENYPTQMGNAPAAEAYPRFSLGPGQRFSSKGAHIVRFEGKDLRVLKPVEEWLIP